MEIARRIRQNNMISTMNTAHYTFLNLTDYLNKRMVALTRAHVLCLSHWSRHHTLLPRAAIIVVDPADTSQCHWRNVGPMIGPTFRTLAHH